MELLELVGRIAARLIVTVLGIEMAIAVAIFLYIIWKGTKDD